MARSLYAITLISFIICHSVSVSAFHVPATFLYQCLFLPSLYSLCPPSRSSVIMTFKTFLMLLHDGEAIWQWHSASLCVNLTGNVVGTQWWGVSWWEACWGGNSYLHFNSKKCQSSHLRTLCAGWWDNVCECVFVCECAYLSLIDRAKKGTDDRAFINLVWMAPKWNV